MTDFTVLVLQDAYGTAVAATLDMLWAARSLARQHGGPTPTWRVCSPAGGMTRLQSGLQIPTESLTAQAGDDRSVWIIPGLALNTQEQVQASALRSDVISAASGVAAHLRRGGRVAACCSGVFLLHFAGALEGRRVTTAWWLAPLLRQMEPRCQVDSDAMVCADGPVITGGAAFAQTDLMLHLIREHCGTALSDAICRFLLIDGRQAQGAYVIPEVLANGDALVSRLVARIEMSLPEPPSVVQLAQEFCVSQRTLARKVRRATGRSTIELIQGVKLRAARTLLEQSRYSVEHVAAAVGYSDSTALRRLMKRVTGSNPGRYRGARAGPKARLSEVIA